MYTIEVMEYEQLGIHYLAIIEHEGVNSRSVLFDKVGQYQLKDRYIVEDNPEELALFNIHLEVDGYKHLKEYAESSLYHVNIYRRFD